MIAQMSVQIILALNIIRMLKLVDSTNLSFVDASRIGSNPFSDKYNFLCIYILYYMDPFVQWLRPNFFNVLIRVRTPYGLYRGYSLIGKTAILHIVNLGSSPDISKFTFFSD
jgi:hypothetical protein